MTKESPYEQWGGTMEYHLALHPSRSFGRVRDKFPPNARVARFPFNFFPTLPTQYWSIPVWYRKIKFRIQRGFWL